MTSNGIPTEDSKDRGIIALTDSDRRFAAWLAAIEDKPRKPSTRKRARRVVVRKSQPDK